MRHFFEYDAARRLPRTWRDAAGQMAVLIACGLVVCLQAAFAMWW